MAKEVSLIQLFNLVSNWCLVQELHAIYRFAPEVYIALFVPDQLVQNEILDSNPSLSSIGLIKVQMLQQMAVHVVVQPIANQVWTLAQLKGKTPGMSNNPLR